MMVTAKKAKLIAGMPLTTPYESYRGTDIWKRIDNAICDLVHNHDLIENTQRDYIVGYICQKVQELKEKS